MNADACKLVQVPSFLHSALTFSSKALRSGQAFQLTHTWSCSRAIRSWCCLCTVQAFVVLDVVLAGMHQYASRLTSCLCRNPAVRTAGMGTVLPMTVYADAPYMQVSGEVAGALLKRNLECVYLQNCLLSSLICSSLACTFSEGQQTEYLM